MGIRIIIDSTTDLGTENQLTTVPLTIRFGDAEYVHGVDMDNAEFYNRLTSSDVMPTTSQPAPAAFEKVFREAVEAGDTVICIIISQKLSGTYQSASIAAEEFPGSVFVTDSGSAAIGAGILVQYAQRLVREGACAAQILRELEEQKKRIRILAMVDTLEYLKKGGRISKTVAFAGELLQVKPVLCVQNGEIKMVGKARGAKQGNLQLIKEIANAGGMDRSMPFLLGYTGQHSDGLQRFIADSPKLWEGLEGEPPQSIVGSVVGTHAGPGAVAVAFFAAE